MIFFNLNSQRDDVTLLEASNCTEVGTATACTGLADQTEASETRNPMLKKLLTCPGLWHFSVTHSCTKAKLPIVFLVFIGICLIAGLALYQKHVITRPRTVVSIEDSLRQTPSIITVTDTKNPLLNYGVVIDCGSSGSRIYVYFWPPHDGIDEELLNIQEVIDQNLQPVAKKVSPGLSSFGDKPSEASDYLKPLLQLAADHIPKNKHKSTPLYILATAGMRMLPESEQRAILDDLMTDIPLDFDFLLSERHAEVITGKEEGVYSWITINYLLGKFDHRLGDDRLLGVQVPGDSDKTHIRKRTVGMLDMGGGSLQIAFEVPNSVSFTAQEEIAKNLIAEFSLGCKESDWGHSYRIYVTTFLGYGANIAKERHHQHIVDMSLSVTPNTNSTVKTNSTIGLSEASAIIDPCMPGDFIHKLQHRDRDFYVKGIGDYEKCQEIVKPLLNLSVPCSKHPCSFNGVFQPQIYSKQTELYGFSEFYYTMEDTLHMGGKYDYMKFRKSAMDYCSTKWSILQDRHDRRLYPKADRNRLVNQCFKSAWMTVVLHDGFKVPKTFKDLTSVDLLHGKPVSWTLGALLHKTRFYPLREIEKQQSQHIKPPPWVHSQLQYAQYLLLVCVCVVVGAIMLYLRRLRIVRSPNLSRVPSMTYFMTDERDMPGVQVSDPYTNKLYP